MLSPILASIALALLIVIGLALAPMVRRSQDLGRYVAETNLNLLDAASQFLGGLKLAVSQNLQGAFASEFRDTLKSVAARQVDNIRQRTQARLMISLLSSAVAGAIVLIGFGFLHVPPAVLIALLLIISRMGGPVGQIQQGLQQVAFALPAYDKVVELKRELAAVGEGRAGSADAPFPEGAVVFEAVSFRHPSAAGETSADRGVERIDLVLRPGDFLGVAGASGAGKTTFADLLVGLIPPQQGRITVGGRPLEGAVLAGWREGISYVSQDPFLFHDTVRRNLAWACPSASETDMWRALALAEADALVRRMEKGLDCVVGERGGAGLRRRAAADRPGPRHPARPARAGAGRSHQRRRRSDRASAARAARRADARPDDRDDRASAREPGSVPHSRPPRAGPPRRPRRRRPAVGLLTPARGEPATPRRRRK